MLKQSIILFFSSCLLLWSCIGTDILEDFVEPQLEISAIPPDTLVIGNTFQLEISYRNTVGLEEDIDVLWESSDFNTASVDQNGLLRAENSGNATITATYNIDTFTLTDQFSIVIASNITPQLFLENSIDTLGIDDTFLFMTIYRGSDGVFQIVNSDWTSSDTAVASIDINGNAKGKSEGNTTIEGVYNDGNQDFSVVHELVVSDQTVVELVTKSGSISTTSSYDLEGSFTISEQLNGDLNISFGSDYNADMALPGLYVYLTNNRNSNAASVAFEIGPVTVFSGTHTYTLSASENIDIDDYQYLLYYCKPFSVKVGDGAIN